MDEATPHMHVVFVPLTPDHRLSAKEILGNRKKLIQWQDRYYEYMAARYPDLSRGESAVQTKHQHMDTQEYKAMTAEIRKMTRLADQDQPPAGRRESSERQGAFGGNRAANP